MRCRPRSTSISFPPPAPTIADVIAGTSRVSAHGSGIAIDIAVEQTDYWRWGGKASGGRIAYKNRIPLEIVHIFERHGFIWGGRWSHYDTMHFEYRPELLPPLEPSGCLQVVRPGTSPGAAVAVAQGRDERDVCLAVTGPSERRAG